MTGATIAASSLGPFPSPAAPSSCPAPLKFQVPLPIPALSPPTPVLTSETPHSASLPSLPNPVCTAQQAWQTSAYKSWGGENFEVIFFKKPSNYFSWETKIFFRILNFVALFTVLIFFYFELDR